MLATCFKRGTGSGKQGRLSVNGPGGEDKQMEMNKNYSFFGSELLPADEVMLQTLSKNAVLAQNVLILPMKAISRP